MTSVRRAMWTTRVREGAFGYFGFVVWRGRAWRCPVAAAPARRTVGETGQGDTVFRPRVAGENADRVAFIVKLHPGQPPFEAEAFGVVEFHRRRELLVSSLLGGQLPLAGWRLVRVMDRLASRHR